LTIPGTKPEHETEKNYLVHHSQLKFDESIFLAILISDARHCDTIQGIVIG
jgi:hypothetical protein